MLQPETYIMCKRSDIKVAWRNNKICDTVVKFKQYLNKLNF